MINKWRRYRDTLTDIDWLVTKLRTLTSEVFNFKLNLNQEFQNLENRVVCKEQIVTCKVCKCLLYKADAHNKPEIKEFPWHPESSVKGSHFLIYTYYCQAHKEDAYKKSKESPVHGKHLNSDKDREKGKKK